MNAHQRHQWRNSIANIQDGLHTISCTLGDLRYGCVKGEEISSEFDEIISLLINYIERLQYLKENK